MRSTSNRPVMTGGELRRVISRVAILNLAYFAVEFAVAHTIRSVSLFADSIDFLEDATVNALILLALRWHPRRRGAVGMFLAAILLVPGLATVHQAWEKLVHPLPPLPLALSVTALGALAINFYCAYILARIRHEGGSLSRAAFLSARNDVLANIAMIIAGGLTAVWQSVWPDLIVGLAILVMNLDAAREVYIAARTELRTT
jgi:Co/Zn/Cd efflux system component